MKNALRGFLLIFLLVLLVIQPASAGLKFDIAKGAGKVTTTVSGWLETAKKQMDQSATLQTIIAFGKGSIETAKKMKELADKTKNAVDTAISSANTVTDEAKKAANNIASGNIDGLGGVLDGTINDTVGGVMSETADARKLLDLKEQKVVLETSRNDEVVAAQEATAAKVKLADDNISRLQVMISQNPEKTSDYESQIAVLKNKITSYNGELKDTENKIKEKYVPKVTDLDTKIGDLRKEAAEKASEAAAKKLKSLLGDTDKDGQKMEEMIKNNFLEEDEELTNENINRIRAYRKLTAAKDTVAAFNNSWKVKKTRYDNSEHVDEVQENVEMMDGATAALGMDTQLKVENINALLEYTRMMVNDMKMKTANQLAEMNNWKLNRYDKPVTEFNLDDYIFDKKSAREKLTKMAEEIKDGLVK